MPALIDYSSSESDSELEEKAKILHDDPTNAPPAPSSLPPLPNTFHTLYATNVRTSTVDDPSLHSGRIRQIPHVEGTWPSHIQLEWHPSPAHSSLLTNLLSIIPSTADQSLHSLLTSPLGAPTPLHISLSRTLPVLTHQRSLFLEQLSTKVREVGIQSFSVRLNGGLRWASNEDGSRFFLVIKPTRGITEMGTLLRTCNGVVKDCGLGDVGLYNGSAEGFHFSIAWRLRNDTTQSNDGENQSRKKRKKIVAEEDDVLQKAWESPTGKAVSDIEVFFDKVMVRIGNTVHAIDLGKRTESSKIGIVI